MDWSESFRGFACGKLRDEFSQIERCLSLLSDEEIWRRLNPVSNAVGNLVIHLRGNVRQWIVAGLGGEAFERDRPAEFAQRDVLPGAEIQTQLRATVERACEVIEGLTERELAAEFTIQGYTVTGLAAVFHVVEHFSLHTGQIVFATKLLTGKDLSLYDAQGRRLDGGVRGAV